MAKKSVLLPILIITLLVLNSCAISVPSESFDDKVATQVALVYTATALAEYLAEPTATLKPIPSPSATLEATSEPTPEPTATLPGDDPVNSLDQPNWKDDLSNSYNWFKDSTSLTNDYATFKAITGKISAKSHKSGGPIWYDYYEKRPKNLFIEVKINTITCTGDDSFGLAFRAKDIYEGPSYYYSISCNGNYGLFIYGESGGFKNLIANKTSTEINSGSDSTNILGVWAEDERLRLYVNGKFLEEIDDKSLLNDGYVGFFLTSTSGAGLLIELDEIAYWQLN